MAFFPRTLYSSESSFTPLFRLLDDFDNYSRQSGGSGSHGRRSGLPSWQPKFDVRETADNYELHGELPGMNKDNVNVEFADPQTMVIRGRVERTYTAGTLPVGAQIEDASAAGAIAEGGEEPRASSPHQATVEDEDAAQNQAVQSKAASDEAEVQKQPVDKAKYWLTERSVGEFSRSFSFPSRIDQDAVTAGFKDGILSITVPKAKAHEARRIAIN